MRIGFIGLGVMGRRIAANIIKSGYNLKVFDLVEEAVEELKDLGADAASSPADTAAGSDIIFTSLPNEDIVKKVITGQDGVLKGASQGAIIVDLSSITPGVIKAIGRDAAEKRIFVLDAPVSGGAVGAEKGTLTVMIGGDVKVVEKARPVINTFSKKVYHLGELGAGDTAKLVNNLLLGVNMAAVSEALVLGVKAGLDPDVMYDLISQSSGSSYALEAKYPGFISERNFKPGFTIDLQYKDLELALSMSKELGMPLMIGSFAQQIFQLARSSDLGSNDISSIIQVFEKMADETVVSKKSKNQGVDSSDS